MDAETRERLTRIETKFDGLINALHEQHENQKIRCVNHGGRLASLEKDRYMATGAAWLGGGFMGIIAAWWQGHK